MVIAQRLSDDLAFLCKCRGHSEKVGAAKGQVVVEGGFGSGAAKRRGGVFDTNDWV